ncbi:cop9 signalosome complex subunit 3 [Phtheirospermum japonicum]|uniref:Cop9 signalosome complex subunit 3 n=1 Tax=Phtheirospermum japonicum TaxID=374723 RepID=A0A830CYF4_9LAMI|nr:cop9 signalosome complex subunit 3 [Phtheirospermum japonicum]
MCTEYYLFGDGFNFKVYIITTAESSNSLNVNIMMYSTGITYELERCVRTNKPKLESRLTQTYVTLSLQDIANTIQLNGPNEAEMHVLRMVQEGEIYATINQKDGIVRFLEDPEQCKTCEMIDRVDLSIQRIMMLSKKLNSMNTIMSLDPSYLGKVGKECQRLDFDDFNTAPSMILIHDDQKDHHEESDHKIKLQNLDEKAKNMIKKVKHALANGEGCRVYGVLDVQRVAGNFHISVHGFLWHKWSIDSFT